MTDVPEEPAGAEPERGSRRTARVGNSGSPVGSTLSIVLAVVAVIAGFLILRAITDDDDGDDGSLVTPGTDEPGSDGTTPATATPGTVGPTTVPATTLPQRVTTGATVVVANASGIGGSAGAMTTALEAAGYTMGTAGNTTGEQQETSVIYYVAGDPAAQAVAQSVATDMGGLQIAEMPSPPPIDAGLGTSTVLVMVGTDTANKTLADLNPAAVTPPPVAGETTTTAAG
jgi:LytR cell envelope-related transcriptional attenuator